MSKKKLLIFFLTFFFCSNTKLFLICSIAKAAQSNIGDRTANEWAVTKTLYGCPNYIQDAALFDGKLFSFHGYNKKMRVYDWKKKTVIGTYVIGGQINSHGNSLDFGHKLNEDDPYPLLYSGGDGGKDVGGVKLPWGTCQVYKINSDFSTKLVQDIRIDFYKTPLWHGDKWIPGQSTSGVFAVDTDNDMLYALNDYSTKKGSKGTRIFKFKLPDLSSSKVTLSKSDIIDYFDVPFYPVHQGCKFSKGKIYLICGFNTYDPRVTNSCALYIIDVKSKKQIAYINLNDIMTEGEAVVIDKGKIYVAQKEFYKLEKSPKI